MGAAQGVTAPIFRSAARTREQGRGRGWLLAVLLPLVFLSGASGLIYQVLWVRILSLTFGVTTVAVTTVLAGFMAGLALGSFVAGRVVDRVRQPLAVYGVVELGIGVLGLLTPRAFASLPHVYGWLPTSGDVEHGPDSLSMLVRLGLAFLIILAPTTLMGATLPVVVKSSLLRSHRLHRDVSLLYAANTGGAILGTLVAGLALIGTYGLRATAAVAATSNLASGLVALLLATAVRPRLLTELSTDGPVPVEQESARQAGNESISRWLIAGVYALSGFCSLAYEVVWTRFLSLYFDGTTYPFTIMLATVLAGIAAGSYAASPLLSRRLNWGLVFAAIEALLGLSAVAAFWSFSRLHDLAAWVEAAGIDGVLNLEDQVALAVSLATIFPTAFLMGATFPVAARLYATRAARAGSQVGSIYAANVGGAILGSYVAGFVLIPFLGAQRTVVVLASINLLLACVLLGALARPPWPARAALGLASVAALALLASRAPDLRTHLLPGSVAGATLVWYGEDAEATVSVVDTPDAGRFMYLNSRPQARDAEGPVRLHQLLGHVPMLLHPTPREVLVIGLGGGATAGAVSAYPDARVDVIELVPNVIHAARFFGHVNGGVLDQPGVRLRVDDGRNYLLRAGQSGRRYDIITADIIRPHHAGAANLYSVEYYRLAAAALRDDGLMMQWLDPNPRHRHQLMLHTFLEAFPYASLWLDGDLLVGSKQPLVLDEAALDRRLAESQGEALAGVGIRRAADLLQWFLAADEELHAYAGAAPILTDDRPAIEYFRSLPPDETALDLSQFSRR